MSVILMSVTLLGCAGLKALSPYSEDYLISKEVYLGSAACEALLAVLLWTRLIRAALTILVMALSGTAIYLWVGGLLDNAPCGCFGSWHVSRKIHFLLVGSLGMLALATYSAVGTPSTGFHRPTSHFPRSGSRA